MAELKAWHVALGIGGAALLLYLLSRRAEAGDISVLPPAITSSVTACGGGLVPVPTGEPRAFFTPRLSAPITAQAQTFLAEPDIRPLPVPFPR